jgi:drug/metabolite transporter (DMT)-like permease
LKRIAPIKAIDLLLLFVVIIWALNFTVIKASLDEIGPHTFNALRFTLACTIIWIIIWNRGDWFTIPRHHIIPLISLGLFGNLVYQWLFIIGIDYTFAANAAIILGTIPIWVAVSSHFFSLEKMTRLKGIGVTLAFIGVIIIITGGGNQVTFGSDTFLGDLLIIAAAFVFGIYTVFSKHYLTYYSPIQFSGIMVSVGAASLILLALPEMASTNWSEISYAAYGGVIYSGALAIGFAYLVWNYGLHKVGTVKTSTYQNLVPVLGLAFGVIILNEQLSMVQYAGALVTVAGIVLTRKF